MSTLYYVDDGTLPALTTQFLREACGPRGVQFAPVGVRSFDFHPDRQLQRGDLLYRPAVSVKAARVEQFLYDEGVATFYADGEAVFYACTAPYLRYQRAGLPLPYTLYATSRNRPLLREFVRQLGGLPIVVKRLGYSNGLGVMRVDSFPALFSLIDYMSTQGDLPHLCSYVPDAVHWRVIVIGERTVAGYKNELSDGDFRTHAPAEAAEYTDTVPEPLADLALRAARVMRREMGGVDILEHVSGRLYLLESNFPCYYAQAQKAAGIDIAGAMVDHLLAKAERLTSENFQEI